MKGEGVEMDTLSDGRMKGIFSLKSVARQSYLSRMLALSGFWLLTYNIFELVKIAYPSRTGLHEFLSYCFPFLTLFLLSRILLPRLKALNKQKFVFAFYVAVGLYCLSKAQVALITIPFLSVQVFSVFQFLLNSFPIAILAFLVVYSCKKGREEVEIEKRLDKPFVLLAVVFLLISQTLGFATGGRYFTQDDLVRGDLIRDELVGDISSSSSLRKQMIVANNFAAGVGIARDPERALHWYELSFMRGAPDAAYYIGKHYDDLGDISLASEWYTKAADRGNDWARSALGILVVEHAASPEGSKVDISVCGSKKDFNVDKCRQLAISGHGEAQYKYARYLQRVYNKDASVPLMNVSFWYEQAAASDARKAAYQLGNIYEEGIYHRRDFNKAEKWYSLSVQQGYVWRVPHAKILILINKIREGE